MTLLVTSPLLKRGLLRKQSNLLIVGFRRLMSSIDYRLKRALIRTRDAQLLGSFVLKGSRFSLILFNFVMRCLGF